MANNEVKIHCKHDAMVNVSDLIGHPKNRNKHSKDQIDRLAKLFEYHGIRHPIIISKRSGFIVAGHGRKAAAIKLKLKTFPVVYQDFDSEEAEYAFLQADNAIALWAELDLSAINADLPDLGPDFDIDVLGIKNFTVDVAEKQGLCDEDEIPEKVEPKTKLGDIYKLGNHRLMCGDSTKIDDVEKLLEGSRAELCFTSPPYADQREYNGGKELSTEHLSKFISTSFGKVNYYAVNLGYSRKSGEVNQYWDDYIKEAKSCGLNFLSWNIWDRSGFGYTVGQATAMFTIDHEWIFVFGKEKKDLNRTIENKQSGVDKKGTIRESSGETRPTRNKTGTHRQMGTVYRGDIARYVGDDHKHPAMFPVHLPESYIEAMTKNSDVVYEPFGGSGTTMIAAEKIGRYSRVMELDPHYCDVIIARWEKFTGQKVELLNG